MEEKVDSMGSSSETCVERGGEAVMLGVGGKLEHQVTVVFDLVAWEVEHLKRIFISKYEGVVAQKGR